VRHNFLGSFSLKRFVQAAGIPKVSVFEVVVTVAAAIVPSIVAAVQVSTFA